MEHCHLLANKLSTRFLLQLQNVQHHILLQQHDAQRKLASCNLFNNSCINNFREKARGNGEEIWKYNFEKRRLVYAKPKIKIRK